MRIKDIELTISMRFPVDAPDENGVVYTKEAVEKAVIDAGKKQLPIVFKDDSEHDEAVIGCVRNMRIDHLSDDGKYAVVEMNGKVFFGGAECFVDEIFFEGLDGGYEAKSEKVTEFRFANIGISV